MDHKTSLNPQIYTEVLHYSKLLKHAGIHSMKIIVFGSHAKGTSKPWSDVDVCVVSDEFGKNRHSERVRLMQIKDDQTLDIEPHPFNPQDLNNPWDSLAREIKKYGIHI